MTIKQVNEWLRKNENKDGYGNYYKNLINFHKKSEFELSTVDLDNPIHNYIKENKNKYEVISCSGYCIIKRK